MRLVRYFKGHMGAIALIFVLLVAQAFCDLALPAYTARIVDVGIQQGGIEHAAPDRLTVGTHDEIRQALASSREASELFGEAYEAGEDGTYRLTPAGEKTRAELDAVVAGPLAARYNLADADASGDLVAQQGIAAAQEEYAALGYDASAMQMEYLLITALKMMGFVLLSVIIASGSGLLSARTGALIGRELRTKLFEKVMRFSDAEVQRFSTASLITRATNDVQQIQMMSIMFFRMVLYSPILAAGGIIMVARTDIGMSWIIAVAVLVIIGIVLVLMGITIPKFRIMQKLIDRVNQVSREMLTGVQVVRAFGQQKREQERFDDASTQLMRTQLFTNRAMTFLMPTMMLVMNLVSVAIVWLGAGAIDAGTIQTGDMIAFITYSMIIMFSFLILSMLAIIAPRADVSARRIDEVLETDVSIDDPAQPVALDADAGQGAAIAFDHVDFKYADSNEYVLSDITFTAEPGKVCAIVGPTGSGKSTILKLLVRFYDVTDGRVTVDGIDVRALSQHDLRAQLGYVPQKAFLFSGTIASNVGYGLDGAGIALDEAALLDAIDIAQGSDIVANSPEGLQAEISQGGTNVSGGQRQRLAIARALAMNARAYLFDDSFSALDYKTDAALRASLQQRMQGKTQIIVAQRIATVMHADKIIVLDEGRIVGQGTHSELLSSCPQYREIAYSQLSPEELEGGGTA